MTDRSPGSMPAAGGEAIPTAASEGRAKGDAVRGAASPPGAGLPAWQWALRLLWVAIEIILVCWFAQKGLMFVYQGF
jgi:hypothetical protein